MFVSGINIINGNDEKHSLRKSNIENYDIEKRCFLAPLFYIVYSVETTLCSKIKFYFIIVHS